MGEFFMNLGYLSAIACVFLTTISSLFVEHKLDNIGNVTDTLFVVVMITNIFFNLAGISRCKKAYKDILIDFKAYIIFCLFISATWVCAIIGVKYSNAVIFNISFYISSMLMAYLVQYKDNKSNAILIRLFLCIMILCITTINNVHALIGIILGIGGGISIYLYKKTSFLFANKHSASTVEIMMTRFIPVMICLSFYVNFNNIVYIITHHTFSILLFAFISFIIPTYLGQYATNHIGAEHSTIISALIFPLSWFGGLIINNGDLSIMKLSNLIIALLSLIMISSPYIKIKPMQK